MDPDRGEVEQLGLALLEAVRQAAHRGGAIAVVLHFQGCDPIEADVNLLDAYHALGVRAS